MADTTDNDDTNKTSLTPPEPREVSEDDDIPPPSGLFDDEDEDIAPPVELMPEGIKASKPRKKSSKTAKPVDISSLITATPPTTAPAIPRVPPDVGGIQVNHCKNPICDNFGVPPSLGRRPAGTPPGKGSYNITGGGTGGSIKLLKCELCGETPPIKSNQAIFEELSRMSAHFRVEVPEPACKNKDCANHGLPLSEHKDLYRKFGLTGAGMARWQCKACKKTFTSETKATARQQRPRDNKLIFKQLVNTSPLSAIPEIVEIGISSVYGKIDFFYQQCLAINAHYERRFIEGKVPLKNIRVCVDRQKFVLNWSRRTDRRNLEFLAMGSADQNSGYVFGMHLNFDGAIDLVATENDAIASGDYLIPEPWRKHARVWLLKDYDEALKDAAKKAAKRKKKKAEAEVADNPAALALVADTYDETRIREDVEDSSEVDGEIMLPTDGMMVGEQYVMYAHFFYLKRLLKSAWHITFYMDQDSGIRGACLSAFTEEIQNRKVDAFYVKISTGWPVWKMKKAIRAKQLAFDDYCASHTSLTPDEVKIEMIKEEMARMTAIGDWNDRWLVHPFPMKAEPDKAVCHLTFRKELEDEARQARAENRLAKLYLWSSLHGINRFFGQVRRKVSLFERGVPSGANSRRIWQGKAPYDPVVAQKMLTIYRTYYNFVKKGKDKLTPAQRIGLVDKKLDYLDIINFVPKHTK